MSKQDDADYSGDDGGIEQLLQQVGGRNEPTPAVMNEVREAIHAEWRAVVKARKRRQVVMGFAMAAGISGVAVVATLTLRVLTPPPELVATVIRVEGHLQTTGVNAHEVYVGERLATGESVRTDGQSHAALDFSRGLSVRVDADSTFQLAAVDRLVLESGALYIDAAVSDRPVKLDVDTLVGSVRHLGTQYQVRALDDAVIVSVREGKVQISGATGTNVGVAGEQLRLSPRGDVQRSKVSSRDASWQWATTVAPGFAIADQPLSAFLAWVARETGRKLIYQNPQAEQLAASVRLRGSIEGLDADTALAAVLPTTSLRRHETEDDSLVIGVAGAIETGNAARPIP